MDKPKARTCNQCEALGKECAVEPDDRERSARDCPCYKSIDDKHERAWRTYLVTGEWPFDMD